MLSVGVLAPANTLGHVPDLTGQGEVFVILHPHPTEVSHRLLMLVDCSFDLKLLVALEGVLSGLRMDRVGQEKLNVPLDIFFPVSGIEPALQERQDPVAGSSEANDDCLFRHIVIAPCFLDQKSIVVASVVNRPRRRTSRSASACSMPRSRRGESPSRTTVVNLRPLRPRPTG